MQLVMQLDPAWQHNTAKNGGLPVGGNITSDGILICLLPSIVKHMTNSDKNNQKAMLIILMYAKIDL